MSKWEKGQAFKRTNRPRTPKVNNNAITQAEHDRIYTLYHRGNQTQTELAQRFARSIGVICRIVNGQHPLNRNRHE